MKKFNYKKWKHGYSHNLLMEQTGSGTGSGTGSNNQSTGSGTQTASYCEQHQPALDAIYNQPAQLGDHGITQQFVNNMQGRPSSFYQQRQVAFVNKINQLTANNPTTPGGSTNQLFCKGANPMWQAQLYNRLLYVSNCQQNPGTC